MLSSLAIQIKVKIFRRNPQHQNGIPKMTSQIRFRIRSRIVASNHQKLDLNKTMTPINFKDRACYMKQIRTFRKGNWRNRTLQRQWKWNSSNWSQEKAMQIQWRHAILQSQTYRDKHRSLNEPEPCHFFKVSARSSSNAWLGSTIYSLNLAKLASLRIISHWSCWRSRIITI